MAEKDIEKAEEKEEETAGIEDNFTEDEKENDQPIEKGILNKKETIG